MWEKIRRYFIGETDSELLVRILKDSQPKVEDKKLLLDIGMTDPSPMDTEQRKDYIAKVVIFYKDVFEKELIKLITTQYGALGVMENTRDRDLIHKGTINALNLIDDWFQDCIREHTANIRGESDHEETAEQIKQRLKNKINK